MCSAAVTDKQPSLLQIISNVYKTPVQPRPHLYHSPRRYRVVPAHRNHVFGPSQRISKHTLMKPAPSQPVSSGLQSLNFCTNQMPFHRPGSGFLKQEARNWPKSRLCLYVPVSMCRKHPVYIHTPPCHLAAPSPYLFIVRLSVSRSRSTLPLPPLLQRTRLAIRAIRE